MKKPARITPYISIVTNLAVVVGVLLLLIELRQNNAALATANSWTLTQTSNEVWRVLADNDDLADLELAVRAGKALTGRDSLQYAAFVWIRLEQIWSAYDLYQSNDFAELQWRDVVRPTQARAATDRFWQQLIAESPMPDELKGELLP